MPRVTAIDARLAAERLEDARQGHHVRLGHAIEEQPLDPCEMGFLCRLQQLKSWRGDRCLLRAGVFRVRSTLDKSALLERVEDPRDATQAEPRCVGERR